MDVSIINSRGIGLYMRTCGTLLVTQNFVIRMINGRTSKKLFVKNMKFLCHLKGCALFFLNLWKECLHLGKSIGSHFYIFLLLIIKIRSTLEKNTKYEIKIKVNVLICCFDFLRTRKRGKPGLLCGKHSFGLNSLGMEPPKIARRNYIWVFNFSISLPVKKISELTCSYTCWGWVVLRLCS